MKESDIQRDILSYLRLNGFMAWKNHNVGKMPSGKNVTVLKGVSDIIALKDSIAVFIEVKTTKGETSEDQKKFLEAVRRHGAIGVVARSISEVEQVLLDNVLI